MPWRDRLREHGCAWDSGVASPLDLATALLRIAADTKDETRVDHGDPELSLAQDGLASAVDDVLSPTSGTYPEHLFATTLDELCLALEIARLRPGIAAFAAARVVDARFGRTFISAFRSREGARVTPGAPIPVVPFPCERLDLQEQKKVLIALAAIPGSGRIPSIGQIISALRPLRSARCAFATDVLHGSSRSARAPASGSESPMLHDSQKTSGGKSIWSARAIASTASSPRIPSSNSDGSAASWNRPPVIKHRSSFSQSCA